MKVNHRLFAAAAIVGCLSVSLVGCGSNGGEPQAEAKVSNESKVTETKAEAQGADESKEAQCQKITTLNSAVEGEMKEAQTVADKAAAFKKMGEISEKYKQQYEALSLKDEKLQGFQQRIVDMHTSVGTFVSALTEAAEKKDDEAAKAALKDFEESNSKGDSLDKEIAQYCGAK